MLKYRSANITRSAAVIMKSHTGAYDREEDDSEGDDLLNPVPEEQKHVEREQER